MRIILFFISVNYIIFLIDLLCYLLHIQTMKSRNILTPSSLACYIPYMSDLNQLLFDVASIVSYNLVAYCCLNLQTFAVFK